MALFLLKLPENREQSGSLAIGQPGIHPAGFYPLRAMRPKTVHARAEFTVTISRRVFSVAIHGRALP
jgi:hypothetical protein